jgi:hypothetical protein
MIDGTTIEEIKFQTKRDRGNDCCGECKHFHKYSLDRCELGGYPDNWYPPCYAYKKKNTQYNKLIMFKLLMNFLGIKKYVSVEYSISHGMSWDLWLMEYGLSREEIENKILEEYRWIDKYNIKVKL